MPFIAKLIDRAAAFRWTAALSETRERTGSYAAIDGMSSVPCLLIEGNGSLAQELFGREFVCDAVAFFAPGVSLSPNPGSSSGKSDKLTITEKNGRVLSWVVAGFKNNANKNRGCAAALQKWSS